ncbi:MAG: hypothetical protein WBB28_08545 [Crinalium sp.]
MTTTHNVMGNPERETVEQIFVLLGFKRDSFLKHLNTFPDFKMRTVENLPTTLLVSLKGKL